MIGSRYRWPTVALLTACLLAGIARELKAQPSESLLGTASDLTGRFEQSITDSQGNVIDRSEGAFSLLKPDQFRWFIENPGQQLLLSDGEYLWNHDLDLETVTRYTTDTTINSPMQLLVAPLGALRELYDVQIVETRVTLVPKAANDLFLQMTLHYDSDLPHRIELIDTLGQEIAISLRDREADSGLSASDFTFTPPEGVDLTINP